MGCLLGLLLVLAVVCFLVLMVTTDSDWPDDFGTAIVTETEEVVVVG